MFKAVDLLLLIQSDSLFIVAPIVCGVLCSHCLWIVVFGAVLSVLSSFAIISLRKRIWLSCLLALSNMFKLRSNELTDQLYSCG